MRLEPLDEGRLTPRQKELAERIVGRRGRLGAPFRIWLRSPELCDRVEALGAFARFEAALPLKYRELGLCLAARELESPYPWNAHARKTVEEGIPQAAMDAIAAGREPEFDDPDDGLFYRFCTELLRTRRVREDTYAEALERFGEQGLIDTIGVLGNATMLSMCLNVFEVDLPEGAAAAF
jgi:4-carboxymuconolactone decarboxylase